MSVLDLFKKVAIRLLRNLTYRKIISVGVGVEIEPGAVFVFPERTTIGDYVYIGPNTYLNGRGGLTICDHSILGPEVAVLTSMHNYREATLIPYDETELLRPVVIERCVWVGMRAMIMPGVVLGEGCIVGAGAVVTKSFPPGSIIAGNPAEKINQRDMDHYKWCLEKNAFYLKMKRRHHLEKIEKREKD